MKTILGAKVEQNWSTLDFEAKVSLTQSLFPPNASNVVFISSTTGVYNIDQVEKHLFA